MFRLNPFAAAAAGWAFAFAALSFYWAAGGRAGAETLGEAFTDPAVTGDPAFIAFLWLTALLKLLAGLLALALVSSWGQRLPQRLLSMGAWAAGIVLTLYGIALLLQHGAMVLGASRIPAAIGSEAAVRWHLFVWDPVWLVGGLCFLLAARRFRHTHSSSGRPPASA